MGQDIKDTIWINGEDKPWDKEYIKYQDIVRLAGLEANPSPEHMYVVYYKFKDDVDNKEHPIGIDVSVKIIKGMLFYVKLANKA